MKPPTANQPPLHAHILLRATPEYSFSATHRLMRRMSSSAALLTAHAVALPAGEADEAMLVFDR